MGTNKTDRVICSPDSVSTSMVVTPSCLKAVGSPPNAEMLIFSQLCGEILSFCANLLDINERCAPSSNSILASVCLPLTQTGATAVFNKQTELLTGLVVEPGGTIAAVTAVGLSGVVSVVVVTAVFCSVVVCEVVSGFTVTSDGLVNSAPQRLEWCFCLQDLQQNFDVHCEILWCPKQLKQFFPFFTISRRWLGSFTFSHHVEGCVPLQNKQLLLLRCVW